MKLLPVTDWARTYTGSLFRGDLVAGLTVGVMLIPQGMAYAVLAGVPPIHGLYASLIPLVVYTLLGTSRHLAVGVVAIDSLVVVAALTPMATPGSAEFITAAIALAAMTGLIQLVLGFARFGFIAALLSRPVVTGFASAAAITIGMSQLPGLLGSTFKGVPGILPLVKGAFELAAGTHLWSLGIGLVAILILMGIRKARPVIPGALIVVTLGIAVTWWLRLDLRGVAVVAEIPAGMPHFALPSFSPDLIRRLFPVAVMLALIQFTTMISLAKVFAAKHNYRVDPNQELIAVGGMNTLGSLFGSIPVSGSFSRTAVSDGSGGQTPLSNLVAAGIIGLALLFLTPLFYYLPIAVFASIIMVASFGMVDWAEMRLLWRTKRTDGLIALLTFGATLLLGIQEGIVAGIVASASAILYRLTRPQLVELGLLPGSTLYPELAREPDAVRLPGIYILRFEASFGFANADYIRDHILAQIDSSPSIRTLIIDATSINDLDTTAAAVLSDLAGVLRRRNVRLVLAGVKGTASDVLTASGLMTSLGNENFFPSLHLAVQSVQG
ncbi:MAG: SulP family sulfate permease [Rhodothermales bacterium]|jgi:SulP family sulfate permease